MLTVDFDRFPLAVGDRVLDLGCGGGRHAFEMFRRGADVVALDRDAAEVSGVAGMLAAMAAEGQAPDGTRALAVRGDAYALPFADDSFDRVVCAEVLEHLPEDERAIAELYRVLRPGGSLAVSVPRWMPERVCWALSESYHTVEGGHVRIYRGDELLARLRAQGFAPYASHHAHSLHAPYWWLKCAFGPDNDGVLPVRLYHRFLVWDIVKRPAVTRIADRALNPLIGKSLVVYATKPRRPT